MAGGQPHRSSGGRRALWVSMAITAAVVAARRRRGPRPRVVSDSASATARGWFRSTSARSACLAPLSPPTVATGRFPRGVAVGPDAEACMYQPREATSPGSTSTGRKAVTQEPADRRRRRVPERDRRQPRWEERLRDHHHRRASIPQRRGPIRRPGRGAALPQEPRHGPRRRPGRRRGDPRQPQRLRRRRRQDRPVRRRRGRETLPQEPAHGRRGRWRGRTRGEPRRPQPLRGEPGANTVSQYNVGPGGRLFPNSPLTVAAGETPSAVVVSRSGLHVYVTNTGFDTSTQQGTVSQYSVGQGGRLVPRLPRR